MPFKLPKFTLESLKFLRGEFEYKTAIRTIVNDLRALRRNFESVEAEITTQQTQINIIQTTATYTHVQGVADVLWVVNHNLNKRPSVTVSDSMGSEVVGQVEYIDDNNLQICFSAPFSGLAYLN